MMLSKTTKFLINTVIIAYWCVDVKHYTGHPVLYGTGYFPNTMMTVSTKRDILWL